MVFQSMNDKTRETRHPKSVKVQLAPPPPGDLGKAPAQPHPDIEQIDRQGHQQKAQDGIGGGGPPPHLVSATVTGLNSKAILVHLNHLRRLHLEMNQDEDLPHRPPFQPFRAFGGGESATERQFGRALLLATLTHKGVLRTVTLAPVTQRARAAGLAANGAGNNRRNLLGIEVGLHLDARKAPVQQQVLARNTQGYHVTAQRCHYRHGRVVRQHKAQAQGETQAVEDHIGGGDAIETRGARFRPTTDPQALLLRGFAVIGPVMHIQRDDPRLALEARRQMRPQRLVELGFQLRQLLKRQLFIQIIANRITPGRSHQLRARGFKGAPLHRCAQQNLVQIIRTTRIARGVQRYVRSHPGLRRLQDFRIRQGQCMMSHASLSPLVFFGQNPEDTTSSLFF